MLHILLVTFPFFALVLAGFIAGRRGWLRALKGYAPLWTAMEKEL